jgi:hypothetical protein
MTKPDSVNFVIFLISSGNVLHISPWGKTDAIVVSEGNSAPGGRNPIRQPVPAKGSPISMGKSFSLS